MTDMSSIITRAITMDGSARIIFTDSTELVAKAAKIHSLSKTMCAVLGRSLTATSLMGSLLKDREETLTVHIYGKGPAGKICCVSDYKGNVRGYAENMQVELAPNSKGKLDVGGAVGKEGYIAVIRDEGTGEPHASTCKLVSGEIGEDITNYYAESEQTPTVCALGVRVNTDCTIKSAGGFLVQLMPGYDEEIVSKIERNMASISSVSGMIASGMNAEDIISAVFEGIEFEYFDEFDTDYVCNCSRERYLRALVGLAKDDVAELIQSNQPIETSCHFCNNKYTFTPEEVAQEYVKSKTK